MFYEQSRLLSNSMKNSRQKKGKKYYCIEKDLDSRVVMENIKNDYIRNMQSIPIYLLYDLQTINCPKVVELE